MRKLGAGIIGLLCLVAIAGCTTNRNIANITTPGAKLVMSVGTINDDFDTLGLDGVSLNLVTSFRNVLGNSAYQNPGWFSFDGPSGNVIPSQPGNPCDQLFSYGEFPGCQGDVNFASLLGQPPAYRIVTEALNNVAKHSHATRCDIQLRVADYLYIDVTDNGIGLPDRLQPGVGIQSIRERVAELGGTCTLKKIGSGGAHVSVRLPMFLTPEFGRGDVSVGRPVPQAITVVAASDEPRDLKKTIRVMFVDDHRFFREGVRNALKLAEDIQIVAEASNGAEAIELAGARQPDVVLMDLQMPGLNGIEATQRLLRVTPGAGVVILTMVEDTDSLLAAMRAGARGYILKDADENELLRAIRAIASGEALFGPAVARRLLQYVTHVEPVTARHAFPELTEREREVLALMSQGLSNDDTANNLGISVKTVRNQVSSILSKLQVADRDEAITRARAAGLAT